MSFQSGLAPLHNPSPTELAVYVGFANILHKEFPKHIPQPDIPLLCAQYELPMYVAPVIMYLGYVTEQSIIEQPEEASQYHLHVAFEQKHSDYYKGFNEAYETYLIVHESNAFLEPEETQKKILSELAAIKYLFEENKPRNGAKLFALAREIKALKEPFPISLLQP